ncbi:MAG: pyridoxamine 5'-phosphate oxidase [Thermomicrobiales bacterium]
MTLAAKVRQHEDEGHRAELQRLRDEYRLTGLSERDVDPDPVRQFEQWLETAIAARLPEANAMTLATATPEGLPSARTVLLKAFDERGFVFYTNYESQKGQELAANPRAALLFYWAALERQVRVAGTVARVSREESLRYFHSRPAGSQLSALASPQTRPVHDRAVLEARLHELEQRYPVGDIPLPDSWGGYRVAPALFEFWQGRPNRLHDRLRYSRTPAGAWAITRLAP